MASNGPVAAFGQNIFGQRKLLAAHQRRDTLRETRWGQNCRTIYREVIKSRRLRPSVAAGVPIHWKPTFLLIARKSPTAASGFFNNSDTLDRTIALSREVAVGKRSPQFFHQRIVTSFNGTQSVLPACFVVFVIHLSRIIHRSENQDLKSTTKDTKAHQGNPMQAELPP